MLIAGIALVLGASVFPQVRSIELPADNAMAELKPGPGVEVVRANCIACHSTDYIVRQPRSDAKRWEGEVKKMISVYGAPISEADAKVIVAVPRRGLRACSGKRHERNEAQQVWP